MTQPVLDIQQLHLSFPGFNGDVHALNNVSLQINRSEIVGLVGESGSGKSVTAMLIMRLLQTGSYCVHRGQISLLGDDVLNAREKQLRQWRGARVAMIFQEPMTALNPTLRIGLQVVGKPELKRLPCWKRCKSRMPWKLCRAIRLSFQVVCASG